MEPATGIEPAAGDLQDRCPTIGAPPAIRSFPLACAKMAEGKGIEPQARPRPHRFQGGLGSIANSLSKSEIQRDLA